MADRASIQHMSAIFGVEDVELVDIDGSPSGNKVRVAPRLS